MALNNTIHESFPKKKNRRSEIVPTVGLAAGQAFTLHHLPPDEQPNQSVWKDCSTTVASDGRDCHPKPQGLQLGMENQCFGLVASMLTALVTHDIYP